MLDFFSLVQDRKKIQVSVGRVLDLQRRSHRGKLAGDISDYRGVKKRSLINSGEKLFMGLFARSSGGLYGGRGQDMV